MVMTVKWIVPWGADHCTPGTYVTQCHCTRYRISGTEPVRKAGGVRSASTRSQAEIVLRIADGAGMNARSVNVLMARFDGG
jgi:hypothetical protein